MEHVLGVVRQFRVPTSAQALVGTAQSELWWIILLSITLQLQETFVDEVHVRAGLPNASVSPIRIRRQRPEVRRQL
jgi:hypothetical protein